MELNLTYEQRLAWGVIRNLLKHKPEYAAALLEGLPKEAAVNVLQQAKEEMGQLLAVNRAFMEAAAALVKLEQLNSKGTS